MSRDYRDLSDVFPQVSDRLRRLFACACYRRLNGAKSKKCDDAVWFAERYNDSPERDKLIVLKKHHKGADDSRRATQNESQDGGKLYRRELCRELAVVACSTNVRSRDLLSCVWGARTWDQEFDRPILEDMGIIGPIVREAGFKATPLLKKMAEDIYEFDDWSATALNVLADAVQDEIGRDDWADHLRKGRHWRGCYVLDNLIGKG